MITSPLYWISALLLASLAVCWADVLVRPGMLLCGVQAWVRGMHRRAWIKRHPVEESGVFALNAREQEYWDSHGLDEQWWWKPLWGCPKCVAGQWGFWGFLLLFPLSTYSAFAHLGFAAVTILLSILIQKWSQ